MLLNLGLRPTPEQLRGFNAYAQDANRRAKIEQEHPEQFGLQILAGPGMV